MTVPNLLMWTASLIAAVWKFSQLVRAPHDKGLRVVCTCTALVFLALSAQLTADVPVFSPILPAQFPKLAQNVLLTVFFTLLIVLLHTNVAPRRAAAQGYGEIGLALLTTGTLTATFAATAPEHRGSYEAADTPGMLGFYLVGNLYMSYACVRGTYLAWTRSGHVRSRTRFSLRVAAAGLALNALGTHLPRVLSTTGRLTTGADPVPGTAVWTTPVLAVGICLFFLGIGYPGVRTGIIKARLWFTARQTYLRLRPLWSALADRYPKNTLFPRASPTRERLQLQSMRLRCYRRIIEVRDGLVCLSPYLAEPVDSASSPAAQARQIRDALLRSSTDETPSAGPSVIAPPTETGMDADARQLTAIAEAFANLGTTEDTISSTQGFSA